MTTKKTLQNRFSHKRIMRDNRGVSPVLSTIIISGTLLVILVIASFASTNVLELQIANTEFEQAKTNMMLLDEVIQDVALRRGSGGYVQFNQRSGGIGVAEHTEQMRVIGPGQGTTETVILRPNAAGTYQAWATYGSGNTHWDRTSDVNDATGVQITTSTTARETEALADSNPIGTINSVTVYMRAKASGSGDEQAVIIWRTHGTDYESGANTISTTAFADYSQQRTTNPNTGLAWTWTEVNSLEIGSRASTLGGTITFVGVGAKAAGTGAVTPALPTGLLTNDILLLFAESNTGEAVTIPTPNGGTWTEVADSPQNAAGTRLTVFWSRYNGAQGNPTTNDPGDHICAAIAAWRGCVTSGNPWDVTSGGAEDVSDTSLSATGDTTTVVNTLVIIVSCTGTDANTDQFSGWANSDLSSVTERADYCTTSGAGGGFGVAEGGKANAGSYGATTATLATASTKGFITIALKSQTETIQVSEYWIMVNRTVDIIYKSPPIVSVAYRGGSHVSGSETNLTGTNSLIVNMTNALSYLRVETGQGLWIKLDYHRVRIVPTGTLVVGDILHNFIEITFIRIERGNTGGSGIVNVKVQNVGANTNSTIYDRGTVTIQVELGPEWKILTFQSSAQRTVVMFTEIVVRVSTA